MANVPVCYSKLMRVENPESRQYLLKVYATYTTGVTADSLATSHD